MPIFTIKDFQSEGEAKPKGTKRWIATVTHGSRKKKEEAEYGDDSGNYELPLADASDSDSQDGEPNASDIEEDQLKHSGNADNDEDELDGKSKQNKRPKGLEPDCDGEIPFNIGEYEDERGRVMQVTTAKTDPEEAEEVERAEIEETIKEQGKLEARRERARLRLEIVARRGVASYNPNDTEIDCSDISNFNEKEPI